MPQWTEQQIIDRLHDGWVLEGDIDAEEPFVFIYPLTHSPAQLPFPTVPIHIIRALASAGDIAPTPGATPRYWKLRS